MRLYAFWLLHQFPYFTRRIAGAGDVLPTQLCIAFRHLDIRVPEDLRQLIKITAVPHVPGCEGVTQIVEPEISDGCSFEQIIETSIQSLTTTCCALSRWGNPVIVIRSIETDVVVNHTGNAAASRATTEGLFLEVLLLTRSGLSMEGR